LCATPSQSSSECARASSENACWRLGRCLHFGGPSTRAFALAQDDRVLSLCATPSQSSSECARASGENACWRLGRCLHFGGPSTRAFALAQDDNCLSRCLGAERQ